MKIRQNQYAFVKFPPSNIAGHQVLLAKVFVYIKVIIFDLKSPIDMIKNES